MREAPAPDRDRYRRLIDIGIALSAERDHARLQEQILLEAKDIAAADGGSLYLMTEDDRLRFAIMRTDSLGIALGGTTGREIPFEALPLHDEAGRPNHQNVATHVALSGKTSNIRDAYDEEDFDFAGTKAFDEKNGYRSRSFLTVPLKNKAGVVTGVLQLINVVDPATGEADAAAPDVVEIVEALASQAAVSLENQQLLQAQKDLFDSFIRLIAKAIDAKSPYTAGHCQRVPVIAEMLADAACRATDGPFAEFDLGEDARYEFHLAAWMHDCGKITTPEHVVDKATKLETVHDRIAEVVTRLEVLKRDAEIAALRGAGAGDRLDASGLEALRRTLAELDEHRAFLERVNVGGEVMRTEDRERVEELARLSWHGPDGAPRPLLTDEEAANLCIGRGTLNESERKVIQDHVSWTYELLTQLPFPRHLSRVPEIAGGHHEAVDGSGYPRGLGGDELDVPTRILAIADVFEALTAADRPYKPAKPLSESLGIMARMVAAGHVDGDLFALFLREGIHQRYGQEYLKAEQLDAVDVDELLGSR